MSKAQLARRLADHLDTSVARARRIIENQGAGSARAALPARSGQITGQGSRGLSRAQQVGLAGAGLGTGGLLWRREGRLSDEAEAERAQMLQDSVDAVLESDTPPAMQEDLIRAQAEMMGFDPDDDGFSPGDLVPSVPGLGTSDVVPMILTIVIVLIVVNAMVGGE